MTAGEWVNVVVAVTVPVMAGLAGWLAKLNQSVNDLRVQVAGRYHDKTEIAAIIDSALAPVNRDLEEIKRILYLRMEHDPSFRTRPPSLKS